MLCSLDLRQQKNSRRLVTEMTLKPRPIGKSTHNSREHNHSKTQTKKNNDDHRKITTTELSIPSTTAMSSGRVTLQLTSTFFTGIVNIYILTNCCQKGQSISETGAQPFPNSNSTKNSVLRQGIRE